MLKHQQAVDRLLHSRRAQGMTAHGLRRTVTWHGIAEQRAHGLDFLHIANRRTRAMRIDVVNGTFNRRPRQFHAANGAFTGRCHHVVAVRSGTVAHQLGIDLCATRPGVFQLLHDNHACA